MNNNPAYVRALYIFLVPIVLLIILLNSGWLQSFVPAVHINGQKYSVVRYNFYYFDYVNEFLDQDPDTLSELGYDTSLTESKQQYSDDMTWRDYFMSQSQQVMQETAYYYDLAVAAGYEFSENELLPIQEKLDANEEERASLGLTEKNYYLSYYGSGANVNNYTQELTKKVKAEAYKAYLEKTYQPSDEEVDAQVDDLGGDEYNTANLSVITLDALPDRETETIGADQIEALQMKLDALVERYENGSSFEELQAAFSTCQLGDYDGTLDNTSKNDLPEVLVDDIFGSDDLKAGDYFSAVDEETGIAYLVVFNSYGEIGIRQEAIETLTQEYLDSQLEAAEAGDYAIKKSAFGMTLVTR